MLEVCATMKKSTPVQAGAITLSNAVAEVAVGEYHCCARKTDGTLWCWGRNNYGQLGDGATVDKTTPVQAGASTLGNGVAEVALGEYHGCARKTDGTLWCWGRNNYGQLGDGRAVDKATPVQAGVSTLGNAVAEISLGDSHTCARRTDGTLWCWGYNYVGQLGRVGEDSRYPGQVAWCGDGICSLGERDGGSCTA